MALGQCRECGGQVSRAARFCPHCGLAKPARKQISTATGCLVVVLVVGAVSYFASIDGSTSMPHDGLSAALACKDFVTARLKAPATAKFQNGVVAGSLGGARYGLGSYVDAQNSFGALIRTHFDCEVTYDMQRRGWVLERLDIRN